MFVESLKMLEVMNVVQQRVANDSLNGTVRCFGDIPAESALRQPVRVGAPSIIDFQSYMREYWLCMLMTDFATWLASLATKEEPLVQQVTTTDIIEFGG